MDSPFLKQISNLPSSSRTTSFTAPRPPRGELPYGLLGATLLTIASLCTLGIFPGQFLFAPAFGLVLTSALAGGCIFWVLGCKRNKYIEIAINHRDQDRTSESQRQAA